MKVIVFSILSVFLLTSCGPSQDDYEKLKKEYEEIKAENKSLYIEIDKYKKEIEELKFGAKKLLSIGINHFQKKNYKSAKSTFEMLLQKHPNEKEAKQAEKYIAKAIFKIKELEKVKAAKKAKKEREEKERIAQATKRMSKEYDELEGITWYKDLSTHPYETSFHLYFGKKKAGSPWLRLKIRYYSDDWLFIKSFFVVADGKRFEKNDVNFERDHGSGAIWEWYDENVSKSDIEMIKAIIESNKATIRFIGNQYHRDHKITKKEKRALQNVIDAFKALGGIV